MPNIKISSKIDKPVWNSLQELAREAHQSISGLLTEAIGDYVRNRRSRPTVMSRPEDRLAENEEARRRLAQ